MPKSGKYSASTVAMKVYSYTTSMVFSVIEYFSSHRIRLTPIIDTGIVFVLRHFMVDLFNHQLTPLVQSIRTQTIYQQTRSGYA